MNTRIDARPGPTLPVTVLTGFLGSGKTTMLARLLADPRFARTAVIINEFGEIGLDHELLEQSQEELVLLAHGCVCCTVRGDLVATLNDIATRRGELSIERVVVETTGLADPAPIMHTLIADPSVTAAFHLDHLVTTVDVYNGSRTLDEHPVAQRQAAMADRLVLTKLDLVDAAARAALEARLRELNPAAPLHEARHGEIDPTWLFAPGDAAQRYLGDAAWLRASSSHDHEHPHDHGDHGHVHDSDIRSWCIVRDDPIAWTTFASWLEMISAMRGSDLLRVKGLVNVLDRPEGPVVIHGVQHVFHPPKFLDRWPSADRRTRLVFITRNIERDDIEATLEIFERKRT